MNISWKNPLVRAVVLLAIAVVAGLAQYRLANIPLPVEISDTRKVNIPPIRSGEKLIVTGLVASAQKRPLFNYRGDPKEVVDIRFAQASVLRDSVTDNELDQKFESVHRLTYTTQRPGESKAICTTDLEAVSDDKSSPTRIVLFQSESPGNQIYRNLAVEMDQEIFVNVATIPPADSAEDTDDDGPGCSKLLAASNLKHLLQGGLVLKTRLLPGARLDLRFLPLDVSVPAWSGYDGSFEPLRFTSPIFQAEAISISSQNGSPTFEATASSPDQPLRMNKLKIGSAEMQTEISGIGFVRVRGVPITLSVFERIKEYPLFAAMFIAVNGALAAWMLSQLRSVFTTQPRKPPKPKRRKS